MLLHTEIREVPPLTTPRRHSPSRKIRLFAVSPKGVMLWVLLAIGALAAWYLGPSSVLPNVLLAVAAASAVDLAATWAGRDTWIFPSSGIITGLFVGLIISSTEPWYIPVSAAIIATGSKYLIRTPRWHVFNPAAAGLVVAAVLYSGRESWWGALPDLPTAFIAALFVGGAIVTSKVNKFPQLLAFLGAYCLLFTAATFATDPSQLGALFRPPFLNAALFLGFFMLSDPPTSPGHYAQQVVYGILIASASFIAYALLHSQYYLLAGLLAGNACFSLWRALGVGKAVRRGRRSPSEAGREAAPAREEGQAWLPTRTL